MFERIARLIERDPARYDQEEWIGPLTGCGSRGCVGGWAIMLNASGREQETDAWEAAMLNHPPNDDDVDNPFFELAYLAELADLQDMGREIKVAAARILGIEKDEADILFDQYWTANDGDVPAALRAIGRGTPVGDVTEDFWDVDEESCWARDALIADLRTAGAEPGWPGGEPVERGPLMEWAGDQPTMASDRA